MGRCLSWKYLSLLLSLLFFHSQFPFSSSLSSNSQCSALLHFNHSLSIAEYGFIMGSNSYPKTGSWKEDKDCCTWDGVVCDNSTRHVIALDLSCSWLNGSIHSNSTLFLLRHLRTLNLGGNFFYPSLISSEFGRFQSLTHLSLSNSGFTGEIPYEISQLSSLVSLDLSDKFNPYSRSQQRSLSIKTPVWKRVIGNLTQLRELVLDATDMSSITPNSSMMNLSSSLTTLSLSGCSLQGTLKINIFRLPCIQTLVLSDNPNLEGSLPKSNWSSSSFEFLSLSQTSFSGELPDSIGSLKFLEFLYLDSCNFTGAIPTSLGNLTQIIGLYLSNNTFSGLLPLSIFDLPNLSILYLDNNQLVGPLSNHVSGLNLLIHLSLSSNFLNGTLPSWLFNLTSLESLTLDHNQFVGEIGEFKCNNSLEYLNLSYNMLQGSIPSSISRLVNLSFVDLRNNSLQGTLPTLNALNLQYLFASKNNLTGEIPSLICNASSLEVLDLSHNSFSGTIPKCLVHSNVLSVLDLRMNSLNGTIPATFSNGNHLRNINLNGNQLEGSLPRSLENCTNLEVLDLGNNKINGTFPYWLGSIQKLQVLVIRSNKFQGHIRNPKTKFPFPNLRILDISNNEFNGPLPRNFFKYLKAMMNVDEGKVALKYMGDEYYYDSLNVMMKGSYIELVRIQSVFTTIDFSNNRFIGEMPQIIGRLKSLLGVNFSHNNLTGYIPSSFGNLTNLEWLDLSFNKLDGEIPKQLVDLSWLEVLKLSHNQLTGPIPLGKQFNTFNNDSYTNNLGLCGFPLTRTCNNHESKQPPPSTLQQEDNLEPKNEFGWQAVLIGYGCGVIFGTLIGYIMFKIGKPKWIVRMVKLEQHILLRRLKNNARRSGGRK